MNKWMILAVMASVYALPAQALSIRNLSGEMQMMTLEQGSHKKELVLPPNDTRYFVGGDMVLTLQDQEPRSVKFEEEYVIWPDGELILQKSVKTKGSAR